MSGASSNITWGAERQLLHPATNWSWRTSHGRYNGATALDDVSIVLVVCVYTIILSRAYKEKRACNSLSIQRSSKNQSHSHRHRQDILSATCKNLLILLYFSSKFHRPRCICFLQCWHPVWETPHRGKAGDPLPPADTPCWEWLPSLCLLTIHTRPPTLSDHSASRGKWLVEATNFLDCWFPTSTAWHASICLLILPEPVGRKCEGGLQQVIR